MIEREIEDKVVDAVRGCFDGLGFADKIQILTAWADQDKLKGQEEADKIGYVVVRVNPREYDTPTIPDAKMQVELDLIVMADSDCFGKHYIELAERMSNVLQRCQNSHEEALQAFGIPDKFELTGFQITGGGVGLAKETASWQFSQSFTLYGIVKV